MKERAVHGTVHLDCQRRYHVPIDCRGDRFKVSIVLPIIKIHESCASYSLSIRRIRRIIDRRKRQNLAQTTAVDSFLSICLLLIYGDLSFICLSPIYPSICLSSVYLSIYLSLFSVSSSLVIASKGERKRKRRNDETKKREEQEK